jgi:hypothetical protein
MVILQPYAKFLELKKSRDYGSMVSHNAHFYSFIPVIHSNLFQNIPIAQKHFYEYFIIPKKSTIKGRMKIFIYRFLYFCFIKKNIPALGII